MAPKTPHGLRSRGRKLWRELHACYDFSEAPERLFLLEDACRVADLVDRLQDVVTAAEDLRVRGSQGQPVSIPELAELRHYRTLLAQLLKALALPDDESAMTFSQRGNAARWHGRR